MQGAEIEGEGAYLKYVTESEYRKQRSSWALMRNRSDCFSILFLIHYLFLDGRAAVPEIFVLLSGYSTNRGLFRDCEMCILLF
ncbi:MAG: hypothetical protein BWY08_00959 [Bacteroidetes bacterium ADurb.Bin174]|nr:MAG: hypothetical protein BWY08_00959 [Bacteroidetes bacterium ADurb.Bin174]